MLVRRPLKYYVISKSKIVTIKIEFRHIYLIEKLHYLKML